MVGVLLVASFIACRIVICTWQGVRFTIDLGDFESDSACEWSFVILAYGERASTRVYGRVSTWPPPLVCDVSAAWSGHVDFAVRSPCESPCLRGAARLPPPRRAAPARRLLARQPPHHHSRPLPTYS